MKSLKFVKACGFDGIPKENWHVPRTPVHLTYSIIAFGLVTSRILEESKSYNIAETQQRPQISPKLSFDQSSCLLRANYFRSRF
jgi:hypothetical protein